MFNQRKRIAAVIAQAEADFAAQWVGRRRRLDEDLEVKSNEFALKGLGRSKALLGEQSGLFAGALQEASDQLLAIMEEVAATVKPHPEHDLAVAIRASALAVLRRQAEEYDVLLLRRTHLIDPGWTPPTMEKDLAAVEVALTRRAATIVARLADTEGRKRDPRKVVRDLLLGILGSLLAALLIGSWTCGR